MAKTWKDRLVKEEKKLDKKVDELESFISGTHGNFKDLPEPDRDLLMTQHAIMVSYLNILAMRMKRLGLLECEDCKEKMKGLNEFIESMINQTEEKEEDGRNS